MNDPVEIAREAVDVARADYNRRRRARSIELWGHPGAHCGSIDPPDYPAVVVEALRDRGLLGAPC